jgi:transposase
MAVRGLGCPVRFTLTAGQKGDAPQAAALIEGLPAEVVMADTAYDADPLRQAIAAKGAIAVIPNNPSRALKYPLDISTPSATWWSVVSQNSSNSAVLQHASKKPHAIIEQSSL